MLGDSSDRSMAHFTDGGKNLQVMSIIPKVRIPLFSRFRSPPTVLYAHGNTAVYLLPLVVPNTDEYRPRC